MSWIADGHHAVPVACNVLIKQKTPSRSCPLLRTGMSAGGRPDGDYILGELPSVIVEKWYCPPQRRWGTYSWIYPTTLKDGVKYGLTGDL